jgi:hypothetical protein
MSFEFPSLQERGLIRKFVVLLPAHDRDRICQLKREKSGSLAHRVAQLTPTRRNRGGALESIRPRRDSKCLSVAQRFQPDCFIAAFSDFTNCR